MSPWGHTKPTWPTIHYYTTNTRELKNEGQCVCHPTSLESKWYAHFAMTWGSFSLSLSPAPLLPLPKFSASCLSWRRWQMNHTQKAARLGLARLSAYQMGPKRRDWIGLLSLSELLLILEISLSLSFMLQWWAYWRLSFAYSFATLKCSICWLVITPLPPLRLQTSCASFEAR